MQRKEDEKKYYIYPVIIDEKLLDEENSKKFTYRSKGSLTTAKELSAKGGKILLGGFVGGMGARMLNPGIVASGAGFAHEQRTKLMEHRVGHYFDEHSFGHLSAEERSKLHISDNNIIWSAYAEMNSKENLPREYLTRVTQPSNEYSEAAEKLAKAGAHAPFMSEQYVYLLSEESPQTVLSHGGIDSGVIFRNKKDVQYFAETRTEDNKSLAEHYIENLNSPLRYMKYYTDRKSGGHAYFEEEADNGGLEGLQSKLQEFFANNRLHVNMKLVEDNDRRMLIVDGKIPDAFFHENFIDKNSLFLKKDDKFLSEEFAEIEQEVLEIDSYIQEHVVPELGFFKPATKTDQEKGNKNRPKEESDEENEHKPRNG